MKAINKKVLDIWTKRAKVIENYIGEGYTISFRNKYMLTPCPYCSQRSACVDCPIANFGHRNCYNTPYETFVCYKPSHITKKLLKLCNDEIYFLKKVIEYDEKD